MSVPLLQTPSREQYRSRRLPSMDGSKFGWNDPNVTSVVPRLRDAAEHTQSGTYTLSAGIDFAGKSNVTRRGAGRIRRSSSLPDRTAALGFGDRCLCEERGLEL